MNRWLSILLLGTYLCSATDLHELFKLPALFAHFAEDQVERPGESFYCFLADHYFDGEHREHEERENNSDLPFNGQHDRTGHTAQVVVPNALEVRMALARITKAQRPLADASSYSFLLSRDVWQPPKA